MDCKLLTAEVKWRKNANSSIAVKEEKESREKVTAKSSNKIRKR